jgi:hypothetical protein
MFRQSWFHSCSVKICTGQYVIFHATPSFDRYVTAYDIVWGATSKLIKIAHTYCGWCGKYYTQTGIRHCHLINTIHQQIVHLVFDIRTKYKHERTINIDETCPWSRGRGAGVMCWYNLVRGVALVWKKHPIHKSHQDKSQTHIYTELLL